MFEREIREYIRLISSISLNQSGKVRVADYLIRKSTEKKELSGKHFAAASAVAVVAVGAFLVARGMKQDINIM